LRRERRSRKKDVIVGRLRIEQGRMDPTKRKGRTVN